ncbi:MAG: LPS assembly protein LptD [Gammaproteobacteria bacterium]|nr:LPS assembly protein LptD [Gammaproteobacteria bacterium]
MTVRPEPKQSNLIPGTVEVSADAAALVRDGVSRLSGNVELVRDDTALRAKQAEYDDIDQVIDVTDEVELWSKSIYWHGDHGRYWREEDRAQLDDGTYQLLERMGRGKADSVEVDRANGITRLFDVMYTTCAPESPAWRLHASKIRLDHDADRGEASHVLLRVRDVPVFYFPWLSFPLSDARQSGFLTPTLGSSADSGIDVALPYYWNIAPHRDATLTPRAIINRGFMLGGQYRYLYDRQGGLVEFEAMPNDSLRNDRSRGRITLEHQASFASGRGALRLDFRRVSDPRYFEDFGRNIDLTSTRFLPQTLAVDYASRYFALQSRLESYQSVDRSLPDQFKPYLRLPFIAVQTNLPQPEGRLRYSLNGEAGYFQRSHSVSGARIDLMPQISYPIRKVGYFLIPKLELRHTEYLLDQVTPTAQNHYSRTVPILSVDSGVLLDRSVRLFGSDYLQSLEPRLFYLLVPRVAQDDLPVFDSSIYETSFSTLFLDNRFSGRDRVGDANQIAAAVTTRLIQNDTGHERIRASLGQIYYFRNRTVGLPFAPDETASRSEFVAELAGRLTNSWTARATWQWDPEIGNTQKATFAVRWQPDPERVLNLAYRLRRNALYSYEVKQTDVSVRWPITSRVGAVARWNFSIPDTRSLETVAGIEYNSCCWAIKFLGRRFLRNTEGDFDHAFFMQVEFKGLAGIGRSTTSFLQQSIPGYASWF